VAEKVVEVVVVVVVLVVPVAAIHLSLNLAIDCLFSSITFVVIFFGSNVVKHLGWRIGALTTPGKKNVLLE